jgi:hypothetical protein
MVFQLGGFLVGLSWRDVVGWVGHLSPRANYVALHLSCPIAAVPSLEMASADCRDVPRLLLRTAGA